MKKKNFIQLAVLFVVCVVIVACNDHSIDSSALGISVNPNILEVDGTSSSSVVSAPEYLYGPVAVHNGVIYGQGYDGGANGEGALFSVNLDGSNYQILHDFGSISSDAAYPYLSNIAIANNVIYSVGYEGGINDKGAIYSVNTDGSNYQLLYSFGSTSSDGTYPYEGVTISNGILYGTTYDGGTNADGVIFSMSSDGSNFTVLHQQSSADGYALNGTVAVSGSTLYGFGSEGGTNGDGTVYSMDTNGSSFQVLHNFGSSSSDGTEPVFTPAVSNGKIYGATYEGGANAKGTVFKLDTDGSNYTILYSFGSSSSDAAFPYGDVTVVGNTIYGTTYEGGTDNEGAVFSIGIDGSNYQVLRSFTDTNGDGESPYSGVTYYGGNLIGEIYEGGTGGYGMVYGIAL